MDRTSNKQKNDTDPRRRLQHRAKKEYQKQPTNNISKKEQYDALTPYPST